MAATASKSLGFEEHLRVSLFTSYTAEETRRTIEAAVRCYDWVVAS